MHVHVCIFFKQNHDATLRCVLWGMHNGLDRLLQFEPQPDSKDSILYDFQTAEQPQRFIC